MRRRITGEMFVGVEKPSKYATLADYAILLVALLGLSGAFLWACESKGETGTAGETAR